MVFIATYFIFFQMATKRIKKEIRDFLNSPVEGIEITPSDSDIFKWVVTLDGPKETPYEVFIENTTVFYQ